MAKGKNRKHRDDASASSGKKKERVTEKEQGSASKPKTETKQPKEATVTSIIEERTFYQRLTHGRRRRSFLLGCAVIIVFFGVLTGGRLLGMILSRKIRSSRSFQKYIQTVAGSLFASPSNATSKNEIHTVEESSPAKFRRLVRSLLFESWSSASPSAENLDTRAVVPVVIGSVSLIDDYTYVNNPSHPHVFAVLREAIVREKGGYVHPDLGFLKPAPCGAARGIGMVYNNYHNCQTKCMPGLAKEKLEAKRRSSFNTTSDEPICEKKQYMQVEVLIKVPLSYQMTRKVALDTLLPLIPAEVQKEANLHELDDAALLVLLLAHERGVGRYSRWLPYITTLPLEPSCGYSLALRPHILDAINAMRDEMGMDVTGWENEMLKATQYADKIAEGLGDDYGEYLACPKDEDPIDNIAWALCQVASRATAGSQKYGSLRMVPLMDMINHDVDAGGFVELTGKERLEDGDFVDAVDETDEGAFVVRSLRHGRRRALRPGQELLVNYNVPHYSALDWFVSLGFVPPERYDAWQKLDAPLARVRQDGPFAYYHNTDGRSDL
ncbi:hypothetical protein IV203_001791 [Nitzschia inconspicua]|uniref:SET domain-containing protein n=1 Tax=Nitzschia inconspicua TaxID=303405 RepID=A0A9K3PRX5_9STRA|nr:hypothetical protein IV203_001791 [Nitzschia inconspicua]